MWRRYLHVRNMSMRRSRHDDRGPGAHRDRKSTRLNSSHSQISYAVFCLKKKKIPSPSHRKRTSNNTTVGMSWATMCTLNTTIVIHYIQEASQLAQRPAPRVPHSVYRAVD